MNIAYALLCSCAEKRISEKAARCDPEIPEIISDDPEDRANVAENAKLFHVIV